MSYKIAIDSCGELLDEWKNDGRIESIPLTLTVGLMLTQQQVGSQGTRGFFLLGYCLPAPMTSGAGGSGATRARRQLGRDTCAIQGARVENSGSRGSFLQKARRRW